MKTDYFSTFLSSLAQTPAAPAGPATEAPATEIAATPPIARGTATPAVNLDHILQALTEHGGETNLPQLAQATQHGVNDLIPAIVQLQEFGLVSFDRTAVRLTSQGRNVPLS